MKRKVKEVSHNQMLTKTTLGQIEVHNSGIENGAKPGLSQPERIETLKKIRKLEISPVQTPVVMLVTPWRGKERKP